MRYSNPALNPSRSDTKEVASLKRSISLLELQRPLNPTLTISDGTTDYAVYDYVEFSGAKLSTVGEAGLKVNLNPYYAICRLSSNLTGVTAETKVTPLSTSLSGFTVSSDVLTCTNGGVYLLTLSVIHRVITAAGISSVGYRINGGTTIFPIQQYEATLSAAKNVFAQVIISLAANDTLEFRFASTATSGELYSGSGFNLVQLAS